MPFTIYNPDGTVASSGGAAGGGSSTAGKAYSPQWSYWTDGSSATMPTTWTNMNNPIIRWNGNGYGTMGAGILVKSPGYVTNLVGFVNGGTSGYNVQFGAYKNNAVMTSGGTQLVTPAQSSSSAPFYPAQPGGTGYTFVPGDLLSVWIIGANSAINQSFSANLEWVFTA